MSDFSPREIVSELDRYIVGQKAAKRAVAIALRNRWRRRRVEGPLREEITPKNILMIGPTGVGKTEISRRLAKLAGAPFLKVEATKFTEVGYVGRDVDSIVRDLTEIAVGLIREKKREDVKAAAQTAAEERVLNALVGEHGGETAREAFRKKLHNGELDDREVEIELRETQGGSPMMEIPGMPGSQMGMINLSDMLGKAFQGPKSKRRVKIKDAYEPLIAEEADQLMDDDAIGREAVDLAENDGIVFLDEIDKIARSSDRASADISREGVQRDLLPLIEGATVATKYGPVKTDHMLFIASGAFHLSKPSDLLPELQGRLPIRVELDALSRDDLRRILTEPEASLIKQYAALLQTEGVSLSFTEDALDALADAAAEVNAGVENIGARRLATIMETVLDEISFSAADRNGEAVSVDRTFVEARLGDIAKNADLSKYIL
ncbi:ATP-dependent protease ATPase subunit HslU [Hyphococcus sp.]|uniref:ATP-dependent protease ATPase subunit HslU n=1 Tax=Hyphococcus sp. TaxID=2038636 RepID=UPI0020857BA4|nr:MAG: ATP-dependent protease ATPase subunit HslU [Marinicaulis sp.]